MDMTLPLRGVTALSLSLYLKHLEMTVELLTALRKTRQIGKYQGFRKEILYSKGPKHLFHWSIIVKIVHSANYTSNGNGIEAIADGKCKTAIDGKVFSSKSWFYGLKSVKTNNFFNAKFLKINFVGIFNHFFSIFYILVIIFVWECKKKRNRLFAMHLKVICSCRWHAVCRRQI